MRKPLLLAVVLALSLPVALAQEAPAPGESGPPDFETLELVPLRQAAVEGMVSVLGVDPTSYRQVTLNVENRSGRRLAVDLCGSYLSPKKKGSCQRLGLGPAITPGATRKKGKGTIVLYLEPGEKLSLRLNTVCLDAGLPCPGPQEFVISPDELPAPRLKVMRWWADNPGAAQGAVNSAIWRFSETVRLTPGTAENYTTPKGSFAALHGGTYYRLVDGALSSSDSEGISRILGSELFAVLPCEGSVYSVALSDDGAPELWRLAMTGEKPWGRVMPIGDSLRVTEVIPAGPGRIAVVSDGGIFVRDLAAGETRGYFTSTQAVAFSARAIKDHLLLVALRAPGQAGYYQAGERKGAQTDTFELWTIDTRRGETELQKRFWNVTAMALGPGGVFGLSHLGVLRKLTGRNFRDFGGSRLYQRILAVGKDHVWLLGAEDELVVVDAKSGALREIDVPAGGDIAYDIDTVSDDLAFCRDGKFYRASAETGEAAEE